MSAAAQTPLPTIAVVIASTRPGRKGDVVARWVLDEATKREDARFELIDLLAVDLPALDEPAPPASGRYTQPHTRAWATTIARFDGYLFVTPEYNHGYPGSLKNALDRAYAEWNHKAAGFVSYGVDGGVRAVEQLRAVVATLKLADVGPQVALNVFTDFDPSLGVIPQDHHIAALTRLLDDLVSWSTALAPLHERAEAASTAR